MAEGFDWYEDRRHGLGHEFLGEVKCQNFLLEPSSSIEGELEAKKCG
jgi:hypothetical protein